MDFVEHFQKVAFGFIDVWTVKAWAFFSKTEFFDDFGHFLKKVWERIFYYKDVVVGRGVEDLVMVVDSSSAKSESSESYKGGIGSRYRVGILIGGEGRCPEGEKQQHERDDGEEPEDGNIGVYHCSFLTRSSRINWCI